MSTGTYATLTSPTRQAPATCEHTRRTKYDSARCYDCGAEILPPCEADCELDDLAECVTCEDTGEIVVDTKRGAMLAPCPEWCATAHDLYDDRGDHDRGKE